MKKYFGLLVGFTIVDAKFSAASLRKFDLSPRIFLFSLIKLSHFKIWNSTKLFKLRGRNLWIQTIFSLRRRELFEVCARRNFEVCARGSCLSFRCESFLNVRECEFEVLRWRNLVGGKSFVGCVYKFFASARVWSLQVVNLNSSASEKVRERGKFSSEKLLWVWICSFCVWEKFEVSAGENWWAEKVLRGNNCAR